MDYNLQKNAVPGSLASQASAKHQSLAETFIGADCVVIVDTSGSMSDDDNTERSRYDRACSELAKIQKSMPGKIAVISFSSEVMFCPSGVPWNYSGGTKLDKALKFARVADVPEMRFIVISDGKPDGESDALDEAKKYKNHIDTIYIGPPGGRGEKFLARLASESGGTSARDFSAHKLEVTVKGLLNG